MTHTAKLKEIAYVFLKLGCFAFGGPAVHIALMEDEIVTRRKWMTREHFLDLIGATNLIPGPNSTEMTMHCGHERAGAKGLFVAGISFILPATIITGILAYLFVTYGSLPQIQPFVKGIQPAVLAIIASAILKLGMKAVKSWVLGVLGGLLLIATYFGVNEVLALLLGGILGACYFYLKAKTTGTARSVIVPFGILWLSSQVTIKASSMKIFWIFLKVGSILYGSGYVLFAYLDAELVAKGLLLRSELIDAIGMGQLTPGPILSTATFIGYQMNGVSGAIAATAGIFLPSFLFVWILNPLIPKMRSSKILQYFLDSVNVAAVAVMLAVLIKMSHDTLIDGSSILIALLSAVIVFRFKKVSVLWVILLGSILGYVFSLI